MMTHATEILLAPIGIADRLSAFFTQFKEQLKANAQYRETVRELSALSDHELNDLGISRGSIRQIASMAVKAA